MSVRALDDALSARNLANLNAANVPLKLLYEDFSQPEPKRPCLLTGGDVDKDAVNDAYEGTGITWRLHGKITTTTQGPRKGTTWRKLMMSAKNQPRRYLHFEQVTTNGGIKEWLLVDATSGGQAGVAGTNAQVGDEAVQHEQLAVAHAAPQTPPPQPTNTYAEARQETSSLLDVPSISSIFTRASNGANDATRLQAQKAAQPQGGGASAQQAHPTSRLEGVTDLVNDTDMVGYTSQHNGGVAPGLGSSFVFPSQGQRFSNLGTDAMEASVVKDAHDVTGASSSAGSKRRRDESDAREPNLDMKALDIRRVMELVQNHPRRSMVPLMRLIQKELEIIPSTACLSVLEGHSWHVRFASYSADGTRIVSASVDSTVRVWDATTRACLSVLEGHSREVTSASYIADGTRIVSASDDKTVRVWDATTGACLSVLEGHSGLVYSASYSTDGTRIVSSSQDKTVRVWDATTGACLSVLEGHSDYVRSASYSADGTRIVSASDDKTVRVWDATTGACLSVLEGHSDLVTSASYSADGTRIVSASWDKTVRIWDATTGACISVLGGHSDLVTSASYSTDGTRIVSASVDRTVRIWNAATGACMSVLRGHSSPVFSASFSADGTRIVSASLDNTVRVWDAT
ncbi:hypothetical protein RI054_44g152540 [Pseudoscourfieldia marina]